MVGFQLTLLCVQTDLVCLPYGYCVRWFDLVNIFTQPAEVRVTCCTPQHRQKSSCTIHCQQKVQSNGTSAYSGVVQQLLLQCCIFLHVAEVIGRAGLYRRIGPIRAVYAMIFAAEGMRFDFMPGWGCPAVLLCLESCYVPWRRWSGTSLALVTAVGDIQSC